MTVYTDVNKNLEVTYVDGQIYNVKVLTGGDFITISQKITVFESSLSLDLWKQKKVTPAKAKAAIWCKAYAAYTAQFGPEVAYKISGAEAGMLKNVELNQELLFVFFTTEFWTKTKTIANYQKHYNELRTIALTGKDPNKRDGDRSGNKGNESLAQALRERYAPPGTE